MFKVKRESFSSKTASSLLSWFDRHRRELPWRVDRDPYRIWVSEVMLQQTTVAAVVPYFERFLRAFPTIQALAATDEAEVLKLWEGLGYYRRARHLHAAARELVATHGGALPDDPAIWQALPGVGRYIMGAVLSQAFDHRLPIVEANSQRVLARFFGYRGDPRAGDGNKWAWQTAEAILPKKRVGDFNQALMELGAIICTAADPACRECPLRSECRAHREGLQNVIPPRKKPRTITPVNEVGVVIRHGAKVLLCKRPANARRWQNMWEVPHAERGDDEELAEAAVRVASELTGFDVAAGPDVATIRHGVTRFRITLHCLEGSVRGGRFVPGAYTEARWVKPAELAGYPVSSPQRRLLAALIAAGRQKRLF